LFCVEVLEILNFNSAKSLLNFVKPKEAGNGKGALAGVSAQNGSRCSTKNWLSAEVRGLSAESGAGPKPDCGSNESWLIVALRLRLTRQEFGSPKSCDQQRLCQ
jgi:hypothetical protein